MIRKIVNKKYREDILNEMWKQVEEGKYAEIHTIKKDKGTEIGWIHSQQVFVKCNHCGKVTNKTYLQPKKKKK